MDKALIHKDLTTFRVMTKPMTKVMTLVLKSQLRKKAVFYVIRKGKIFRQVLVKNSDKVMTEKPP
jgi:hypothetical protein